MGGLGPAPHGDLAVPDQAHRPVRVEWDVLDGRGLEDVLEDPVRAGKSGADVSAPEAKRVALVRSGRAHSEAIGSRRPGIRVDQGSVHGQRVIDPEDGRQGCVLDVDQVEGRAGRIEVHGDHGRNGLADVPDAIDRQRGLVAVDRPKGDRPAQPLHQVAPAEDPDHAARLPCPCQVDALEAGARDG